MKKVYLATMAWALLALTIISCEQGELTDSKKSAPDGLVQRATDTTTSVYQRIISLGFPKESIKDYGGFYIVQNDIKFTKEAGEDKNAKTHHGKVEGPVVGFDKIANVTVTVDNSFPNATWRQNVINATNAAISSWNNIPIVTYNNRINFTYTTGPADITIRLANLGDGSYGLGSWPVNCNPGPTVDLNLQSEFQTPAKLHFTIAHELGHNIGFMHTDLGNTAGWQIPYTPLTEAGSVMNSGPAWGLTTNPASVPDWPGFTIGDRNAVEGLYTEYAVDGLVFAGHINATLGFLRFSWTSSYFCRSTVNFAIWHNGVFYDASPTSNNDGQEMRSVPKNGTFRFKVWDSADPTKFLEDTYTF